MRNFGRTSIHKLLGDMIVYRNLVPFDTRLPPLSDVRLHIGLPEGITPRKSESDYARVIVHLLQQARKLDTPGTVIERLAYLGDTRLNDGTAFAKICRAGGWPGVAFIGSENSDPACMETADQNDMTLCFANRWAALADFGSLCLQRGFPFDERTAIIIDLDKTALGARGRNDHVINFARVEAVRRTVGHLLGDDFDVESFQVTYDCLNQTDFHPFTADNQDYVAYICLIVGSGLYSLGGLVDDVRTQKLTTFSQFIARVDGDQGKLPSNLRDIHRSVYEYAQLGDPTPFKAFRYNEYQATVEQMGFMRDDSPVSELLEKEITVTQEVRAMALEWREQGTLLFALSDKPDEASIPTDKLAAQGYQPIHCVETHAVGE